MKIKQTAFVTNKIQTITKTTTWEAKATYRVHELVNQLHRTVTWQWWHYARTTQAKSLVGQTYQLTLCSWTVELPTNRRRSETMWLLTWRQIWPSACWRTRQQRARLGQWSVADGSQRNIVYLSTHVSQRRNSTARTPVDLLTSS